MSIQKIAERTGLMLSIYMKINTDSFSTFPFSAKAPRSVANMSTQQKPSEP